MEWNIKKLFLGYHFGCLHLITCRSRQKFLIDFVLFSFISCCGQVNALWCRCNLRERKFIFIWLTVFYITVLICSVLNWTELYYTTLTIFFYTVLYCPVLYCPLFYCTVLYCTVLYCTTLTIFCCTAQYSNITYVHLTGSHAKETLQSANQLSSLYRVYGKNDKAEKLLSDSLTISRATFGNMYVLNSNVLYYT